MGFFGGLIKGVVKAASSIGKSALSAATGGASDKVLKIVKGTGIFSKKQRQQPGQLNNQQQALALKIGGPNPRVRITESLQRAGRGVVMTTTHKRGSPAYKRVASYAKAKGRRVKSIKPKSGARSAALKPKAKRAPPKGGLDLKALSASWKAAGKPGTWQGWIQANK